MISSSDARLLQKILSPSKSKGETEMEDHTDTNDHTDSTKHTDYYQQLNTPPHYDFNDHTDDNQHTDRVLARKRRATTGVAENPVAASNALLEAFDRFEQILGGREDELHRDVGARLDEVGNALLTRMTAIEERIALLESVQRIGS